MQDEELDEEVFDAAATRPPLLLGLPYGLCACLMFGAVLFMLVWNTGHWLADLSADAIALSVVAAVWSTAKALLQTDYHGWDNFLAWLRLDCWCLDTREHGGARLASFPLRSPYRSEVFADAD